MVKKYVKKNKEKMKKEKISNNEKEEEDIKENIISNNKSETLNDLKDIDLQKLSKAMDKELAHNLLSTPKEKIYKEEIKITSSKKPENQK